MPHLITTYGSSDSTGLAADQSPVAKLDAFRPFSGEGSALSTREEKVVALETGEGDVSARRRDLGAFEVRKVMRRE